MRKAYLTLFALVLAMAGVTTASAIKADLDPEMFKAWDGFGANANVVAEPEDCPNSDGSTSPFGCDYKLYETVGAGTSIYGNTNVYYLWYADITGTKTITFEGTAGLQLRILMNRPEAPADGNDPHGGQTIEQNVTLDESGVAVLDVSSMEYVHINCIKLGWGSPEGIIRKIELDGTVKPVTGWVDMVDNGDLEGDDVHNFVVALDAVNDPATYPATIVDGAGVDGSRGIVVQSIDDPAETWATQFFVKFNEFLPEGTLWRISMDMRADNDAESGSGSHAEPRSWQAGPFFEPNPTFTTEWQTFEASGTISASQAGANGMGSLALDLNVLGSANKYYFDNIHFEVFRESSPISLIKAGYEYDVIRVDFDKETNMKQLIKNAGTDQLVFDNSCASVIVNGEAATLMSVEGRKDGYLWIFIDEGYSEDEDALVSISFTNPTDEAMRLVYTAGKYEGQAVPDFSNVLATYESGLGDNFSYLLGTPTIVSADPEDGSFNLNGTLKDFKFTFTSPVDVKALVAKFDNEKMTVTPAEGRSKEITLTRTSSNELVGVHTITLDNVVSREDQIDEPGEYELNFSFGPVVIDPNDQPRELIPAECFAECASNSIPMGFLVDFNGEIREGGSNQGSGPRMFTFADGGDFTKALYFREGNVTYGGVEGYELTLEAGKKYNIHFNAAQWKDNGTSMGFEILDDAENTIYSETITPTFNTNGNTAAVISGSAAFDYSFVPDFDGNYILKWISNGFVEVLLGNPQVKYVPNVLGVEELTLVNNSLENAKSVRESNQDDRYNGAAFDALDACIKKYEAVTFTAPSACKAAAAELDAAAKFMQDHRTLCDTYDPLPDQAQEVISNNAEKKFARTDIYKDLVASLAKYGVAKEVTVEDPETGELIEKTVVDIKILKDDEELKTAIDELQGGIDLANAMFTEGASKVGDWSATRTGYATLVDRVRQGAETLQQLGVADDDELIVAAANALSDSDDLANAIKNRIKVLLYDQLKDPNNTLFDAVGEDEWAEAPTYNMTVFVKNPNLYKLSDGNGYTEGAVPGWEVIEGRGFSTGWSEYGSATVPVDAMFSNWGGSFTVYQTVEDLPAGVYTLNAGYGERDSQAEGDISYFYAKTSDMVEDSLTCEAPTIGQAFPEITTTEIPDVVVTDGVLTLGVQASASSHVFFDAVALKLTAAATGIDYTKLYQEAMAGIDVTTVQPQHIRAIEMFDLNGRRVSVAKKGVTILRKVMTDGTIRTEKVIIK